MRSRSLVRMSVVFLLLSMSSVAMAGKPLEEQTNLVELGIFGGVLFPSDNHELYGYPEFEHQPFKISPEFGLRIAYLPLSWLGMEIEGAIMPAKTDVTDDSALVYAFRGHLLAQLPIGRFAPFLLAGGGILGVSSNTVGDDVDGAFHWGGGFKYYATNWLALRVDGRHVMSSVVVTSGGGVSHSAEVLGGLSFVLGWTEGPPPDRDGDGIVDAQDRCPDQASTEPDGCPPPDRDGDGVRDEQDKCPDIRASTPDGCPPPPPDRDGDGVIDADDKCPDEAGPPEAKDGCPPPSDRDGDGVPDAKDMCTDQPETVNSYKDEDGCPDELPKAVKRFTGTIPGITFASGKTKIRRSAHSTLNSAANVLTEYSDLNLLIRGHTDITGPLELNMTLSAGRAQAVKDYLVKQGVDGGRLSIEGLGPNEPIADNATKAGRKENRRIEFKLVTPAAPVAPATE